MLSTIYHPLTSSKQKRSFLQFWPKFSARLASAKDSLMVHGIFGAIYWSYNPYYICWCLATLRTDHLVSMSPKMFSYFRSTPIGRELALANSKSVSIGVSELFNNRVIIQIWDFSIYCWWPRAPGSHCAGAFPPGFICKVAHSVWETLHMVHL